ncbi:MAG: hypothetical protein QXT63_01495 [Thermoplasmata archaeon]
MDEKKKSNTKKIISIEGKKRRVVVEGDESVIRGLGTALTTFASGILQSMGGKNAEKRKESAEKPQEEVKSASQKATKDFIIAIVSVGILLTFAITAYIFIVLFLNNIANSIFGETMGFLFMFTLFFVLTLIAGGLVYYYFVAGAKEAKHSINAVKESATSGSIATGVAIGAAKGAIEGATGG